MVMVKCDFECNFVIMYGKLCFMIDRYSDHLGIKVCNGYFLIMINIELDTKAN